MMMPFLGRKSLRFILCKVDEAGFLFSSWEVFF